MDQAARGTVTFLFTDIERSTRLVRTLGDAYPGVLAAHRSLIESAAAAHGGALFGAEGDGLFFAFSSALDAVGAAADAQRALASQAWPDEAELRVRMGLHTGEAVRAGTDYVGLSLHQAARITAAGHGGQVLLSGATRDLVAAELAAGLGLRDLGEHRLRDLAEAERIYELVIPGLVDTFPPLRTLSARPHNLPVQLTSFVGREEVMRARRLLAETRLLTLTGPGGTGKTRLSLRLAAEASAEFADGVFFVPLETVRDPGLVVPAIAEVLGILDASSSPLLPRVADHLRERELLLVLDNFEQILDAAPTIAELLGEAPRLKVVATSRVPLRVYGEQELPIPPLSIPGGGPQTAESAGRFEAVRLFVERAMAANPNFRLTDENASAATEIVARLDGLPLAIELAAARLRVLPIEAIRSRLGSRLALLTGGARDLPARQRTLRGAIEWSHDLLDEADRRLFARFAIFVGGAALPQAEPVCGPLEELGRDVLDGLVSLTEKSLLRSVPDGEARFAMFLTIQEYAEERLAETPDHDTIERRHTETYLALAEEAEPHLTQTEQRAWLDRLAEDQDNIRAAFDRAIRAGNAGVALRLLVAMWRYWQIRGLLEEGSDRATAALALSSVNDQPAQLRARALLAAGSIAYWRGDAETTHRYYGAALEQARRSEDRKVIADALYNLGFAPSASSQQERLAEGRPHYEEALGIYRELGDERGQANAEWGLALSTMSVGDLAAAKSHATAALERYRPAGDAFGTGWALHLLFTIALFGDRDVSAARSLAREALTSFQRAGDETGVLLLLADAMFLAERSGDPERYWRLAGAVEALRIRTGADLILLPFRIRDTTWELPQQPGEGPVANDAWSEGARLTLDEAAAYALAGIADDAQDRSQV